MWIFVAIGVVLLVVMIASSVVIYSQLASVSTSVQGKLDTTNDMLSRLNGNLQSLDQLNSRLSDIDKRITAIESSTSSIPNATASIVQVQTDLAATKESLIALSAKYPPNQTVILNNINKDDLDAIINNAVDVQFRSVNNKTIWILGLNIASLFSLGGIGFYYVRKMTLEKTNSKKSK